MRDDDFENEEPKNQLAQIQPTALEAQARAEIDVQISTAKRYPRDELDSIKKIKALVTATPEIAEECHYSIPRAGKVIEGPSTAFAQLVASRWGNLSVGSRIVDIGETTVTVQGAAHDLESNVKRVAEVRRKILDREGNRYSEDLITLTCNAAASIAERNAVLRIVPKPIWAQAYNAAIRVMTDGGEPLEVKWKKGVDWFKGKGVSEEKIFKALGISSIKEVDLSAYLALKGMAQSVKEGVSMEDIFTNGGKAKRTLNLKPEPVGPGGPVDLAQESPMREPGEEG